MKKHKARKTADAVYNYLIIDGLLGLLQLLWRGITWVGRGLAKTVGELFDSSP